jgi:hypothetical protein
MMTMTGREQELEARVQALRDENERLQYLVKKQREEINSLLEADERRKRIEPVRRHTWVGKREQYETPQLAKVG